MKSIVVEKTESGTKLTLTDRPPPVFGPDDVIVDVAAAGVNRADLMQREGKYPPPPGVSEILGMEVAGVIVEVGDHVEDWKFGDKVCALIPGGGYSSQVAVPHQMLMPVPAGWSMVQAAAFPEVYFTAFLNLFIEGRLKPGETVLIHGGASGVGTAAIQLAKTFGATVIATAGSDEKTAACRKIGADLAINYRSETFDEVIKAKFGERPIDLVLDPVGGSYFEKNIALLKLNGRIVIIAVIGGSQAQLNLNTLLRNRIKITGSILRNRDFAEKVEIKNRILADVWPKIAAGAVLPVVDSVFPATEAERAHARMYDNKNIGKIVLTFGPI